MPNPEIRERDLHGFKHFKLLLPVLESLHDDIYFDTLDFFNHVAEDAAGDEAGPGRSLAAGNVLPWIHPERRGRKPSVTITYSAFASKDPKIVIALGDCAINCGLFKGSYAVTGPVDRHVPVDVRIPGCPPRPAEILEVLSELRKRRP